jgi:hypothetical protein
MVSSSIQRPRDEVGGAVNHAPDSYLVGASKRAEDMGSEKALSKRDERQDWTLGESQALWWVASEPLGGGSLWSHCQAWTASKWSDDWVDEVNLSGRMVRRVEKEPAAEAK